MREKRTCGTCAWWESEPEARLTDGYSLCCFSNHDTIKHMNSFCRHHSVTRGWSTDVPRGDIRHGAFIAVTPDQLELLTQINQIWEKYTKLLDDWYLMKDN